MANFKEKIRKFKEKREDRKVSAESRRKLTLDLQAQEAEAELKQLRKEKKLEKTIERTKAFKQRQKPKSKVLAGLQSFADRERSPVSSGTPFGEINVLGTKIPVKRVKAKRRIKRRTRKVVYVQATPKRRTRKVVYVQATPKKRKKQTKAKRKKVKGKRTNLQGNAARTNIMGSSRDWGF